MENRTAATGDEPAEWTLMRVGEAERWMNEREEKLLDVDEAKAEADDAVFEVP